MRRLLTTVKTREDLDLHLYENLNIGVEIQDFTSPNLRGDFMEELVEDYKRKFRNFLGIKALHGPFLDLKPASPDPQIREVSYKKYLETLKVAKELEIDYVVFHSQINPYLNEPFMRELNCRQAKEMWSNLLAEVDYRGVILIENIFEEEPDMLKEYIEAVDLPNIKINLDIGHANLGKVSLETWISLLKDHIAYIHVHSNDGLYDQHVSPTDSRIEELYSLLDKYQLDPVLSLEYQISNLENEINRYL